MAATLIDMMPEPPLVETPPPADLRSEIYKPLPKLSTLPQAEVEVEKESAKILEAFGQAIQARNSTALRNLLFSDQVYLRDTVALTYYRRTFSNADTVAQVLLELGAARQAHSFRLVPGHSHYIVKDQSLAWILLNFTFETTTPKTLCGGHLMLVPVWTGDTTTWKIWVIVTYLKRLLDFPEDLSLLTAPSARVPHDLSQIETGVLIVGAGNSGLILATELKALKAHFVLIDQLKHVGDSWEARYDAMRFHTSTPFGQTSYLAYPESVGRQPTRNNLRDQMKRYAKEFDLPVIHETTPVATAFDEDRREWRVKIKSPRGVRTVVAKHLVMATGVGSWLPLKPQIGNPHAYKGIDLHSVDYRNGQELRQKGVKSVVIIGSANTAFDVIEDCYNAGLDTHMVQRSATFLLPMEYMDDPGSLGIFDFMTPEFADPIVLGSPLSVGGQLLRDAHAQQAAKEPSRYDKLAEVGFKVVDATVGDLAANLYERTGGHFVDMGEGVRLLSERKVGLRSGVYPTAYTPTGLELSDGSALDADSIIWCTGYRDKEVRDVVTEILGDGSEYIRARMDPTRLLDIEGESRGLFRPHKNLPGFWVIGVGSSHQRWYGKQMALHIKAALENIAPTPYMETPQPDSL